MKYQRWLQATYELAASQLYMQTHLKNACMFD